MSYENPFDLLVLLNHFFLNCFVIVQWCVFCFSPDVAAATAAVVAKIGGRSFPYSCRLGCLCYFAVVLLSHWDICWRFCYYLEIRGSCCRSFFSVHKKGFTNVAAEGMSSISKTRHRVLCQNFSVVLVTMRSRKLHQVLTVSPRFAQK